jgi:hypothetical protein
MEDANGDLIVNTIKSGKSVAMKFEVFDNGIVEQASTSVIQSFKQNKISCATLQGEPQPDCAAGKHQHPPPSLLACAAGFLKLFGFSHRCSSYLLAIVTFLPPRTELAITYKLATARLAAQILPPCAFDYVP